MRKDFYVCKVLVVLVSTACSLSANAAQSSEQLLTAAKARSLAVHAASSEDHFRLATYYSAKASAAKANLTEEQNLMLHWANVEGMADRNKIPNPYWSAKTLAEIYRAQLEMNTKLAEEQQSVAVSLQGHLTKTQ